MKLIRLKLRNFRQFYGDQEIEFSTNRAKHITLIHGENSVGKTTIQSAVIWCLFGRVLKGLERPDRLVNLAALEIGVFDCEVRIQFSYEQDTYEAVRVYNQRENKSSFALTYSDEDGNVRAVPKAKELVNQILPDAMAQYFFFEGEGLGQMIQQGHTQDAIRAILGFTYAQAVTQDLRVVERLHTKELAELRGVSESDKQLLKDIAEKKEHIEKIEKQRDEAKQDRKKFKTLYDQKVAELTESKYEEISDCQTKINRCKEDLKGVAEEIKGVERKRQSLVLKYGWAIFGQKMVIAADGMIDEKEAKGRVPAPHDEPLVNDIIEAMSCICGRPITENSPEYYAILDLRKTASNAEIKRKISNARSYRFGAKGKYLEFLDEIRELEKRAESLERREQEIRKEEGELKKKQEDYTKFDHQKTLQERDDYEKTWHAAIHKINSSNSQIAELEKGVDRQERELNVSKAKNKRFEKFEKRERFIKLLGQRCMDKLQEFELEAVESLADCNNSALAQISRQHRRLILDNDLTVRYVDENGQEVGNSAGENLLLNLVFVSCLINFARKRLAEKNDFVIHGTIAPFLLDAPFGVLDKTYRERAVKYVAESTDQLIFLLSSSHWQGVDETIRDKIGKEYILVNHQTDPQGERTDDVITVGGKSYSQSLYEQERKFTEVREVTDGNHD